MEVIDRIYCGGNTEYDRVAGHAGWSWLRCCKEGGNGCHRQILGYTTLGAPKGPNYFSVRKGRHLMALNILDIDESDLGVPDEVIDDGLEFADERYRAGDKVLFACNAGHTRGPLMCMAFLRTIGELPNEFLRSEKIFKTLYPKYDPGRTVRTAIRKRWDDLKDIYVSNG
jgi:hypothetical protein